MGIPAGDSGSFDQVLRISQFLVFALGIGGVLWKLSGMATKFDMTGAAHSDRMDKLEVSITKLSDVLTAQAVQNVRLDNQGAMIAKLMDDISLLRRGESFIRREIDGPYLNADHGKS